jgi:hypothetical protein
MVAASRTVLAVRSFVMSFSFFLDVCGRCGGEGYRRRA